MDELMTKEEFLQGIAEYGEVMGVTVADFDDIDIEVFIAESFIRRSTFENRFATGEWDIWFDIEIYLGNSTYRSISAYESAEIRMVDSTDEEFEEFLEAFIEAAGGEFAFRVDTENIYVQFDYQGDGHMYKLLIVRTMHIDDLNDIGWGFSENPAFVSVPYHDSSFGSPLYMSKDGKYFLFLYGGTHEERLHLISTFCTIG